MVKPCEICDKQLITYTERIGSSHTGKRIRVSDEGVCFTERAWFCNECWDEIIKWTRR